MIFWGYKNEEDARRFWPELDKGIRTIRQIKICTPNKKSAGSIDGINYMYYDGATDTGVWTTETTVIIENNKIRF